MFHLFHLFHFTTQCSVLTSLSSLCFLVLCDENGRCMIADLGLACSNIRPDDSSSSSTAEEKNNATVVQFDTFEEEDLIKSSWAGTAAWMAPEVTVVTERQNFKKYSAYGFKADVFSFGVVMFELLTGRIPWAGTDKTFAHQIMKAVVKGERPVVRKNELASAPKEFINLMHQCWDTDANTRPTFDELVETLGSMHRGATSQSPRRAVPRRDRLATIEAKKKNAATGTANTATTTK